jgi:hypothetical protein
LEVVYFSPIQVAHKIESLFDLLAHRKKKGKLCPFYYSSEGGKFYIITLNLKIISKHYFYQVLSLKRRILLGLPIALFGKIG